VSIHTCSYYCDRPGCVLAQRDELRQKLEQAEKQWVGLTNEEKHKSWVMDFEDAFQYIEAKLKEKNIG
jgi:hypothetical protein